MTRPMTTSWLETHDCEDEWDNMTNKGRQLKISTDQIKQAKKQHNKENKKQESNVKNRCLSQCTLVMETLDMWTLSQ